MVKEEQPVLPEGYHWVWNPLKGWFESTKNNTFKFFQQPKLKAPKKKFGWYRDIE